MPIWKTKYGWRTRVEVAGRKHDGPAFRYKSQAQAWCEAEKERPRAELSKPASQGLSLYELAQFYLDEAQTRYSHKHLH